MPKEKIKFPELSICLIIMFKTKSKAKSFNSKEEFNELFVKLLDLAVEHDDYASMYRNINP